MHKMLGMAASIAIKNNRLGGNFQNFIDGREARGPINQFGVGLALGH